MHYATIARQLSCKVHALDLCAPSRKRFVWDPESLGFEEVQISEKTGGHRQDATLTRQDRPICPGRSSAHGRITPQPGGIIPPAHLRWPLRGRGTLFADTLQQGPGRRPNPSL
jgi:hypothetical protein